MTGHGGALPEDESGRPLKGNGYGIPAAADMKRLLEK